MTSTNADGGRWLGIDFSGDHRQWGARREKSNVWISDLRGEPPRLELYTLVRVQELPGMEPPFERLTHVLKQGHFKAAAIDAPFSIPQDYLPPRGHRGLLELVGNMRLHESRPFPTGAAFKDAVLEGRTLKTMKPLRATERHWAEQGVNVRSTLWVKPRGGAAMTAACLLLLQKSGCPIWPWEKPPCLGLLVEAFPAAQLNHWGQIFQRYNGDEREARENRKQLVNLISSRVDLCEHGETLLNSADALDAVVCAFAAVAVTGGCLQKKMDLDCHEEGWIAVHN